MKKRVGIVLVMTVLLLSGCTIVSPLKLMEMYSEAKRGAGESASARVDSEAESEAQKEQPGDEARKDQKLYVKGQDDGEAAEENQKKEADSQDDGYVKGTVTDYGWESEYWNLSFVAPEDVYMISDEGLAAVKEAGQEKVAEERNYTEAQQNQLENNTLYEMMAATSQVDASVLVSTEKLMMRGMTVKSYRKAAVMQLMLLGLDVTILDDSGTAEIAGETYAMVNARIEEGNTSLQDYYFRVVDGRALCIVVTYTEETAEKAAELLEGFDVY